jgi:hypothetical protein
MSIIANTQILRPQQHEYIFDFYSKNIHIIGGNRSGKTEGLIRKAVIGSRINKGERCLLLEPTTDMANEILQPKITDYCNEEGIAFKYEFSKRKFLFPDFNKNGKPAQILLRSADKPNRIEGGQYWGVGIDEPAQMKKEVFRRVKTRVNSPTALICQLFTSGTPEGFNHYFHEVYKPGHRIVWGSVEEIKINTRDGYIDDLKEDYDDLLIQEKLLGKFINTTSGVICYAFKESLVTQIEPDFQHPLYVICDFNINPCGWVLAQFINGKIRVIDELCVKSANTFVMCEKLADKHPEYFNGLIFYGDYTSTFQRSTATGLSDWHIIEQYFKNYRGYERHLKPNPSVKDSINILNNGLAKGKIIFDKKAVETINDMRYCVWAENGKEIEKKDKERTHWLDDMRYISNALLPIKERIGGVRG